MADQPGKDLQHMAELLPAILKPEMKPFAQIEERLSAH